MLNKLRQIAPHEKLQRRFGMGTHTQAWKHYAVRPASDAPNPAATKSQFCVYDPAHGDYLYTLAWIDFLIQQLADETQYNLVARVPVAEAVVSPSATPQILPAADRQP